ncbi:hypothetical protein Tco_0167640, partial [Tanacetum coccineum]
MKHVKALLVHDFYGCPLIHMYLADQVETVACVVAFFITSAYRPALISWDHSSGWVARLGPSGHIHEQASRELLKEPSNHDLIKPMLLNFNDDAKDTDEEVEKVIKKKGKEKSVTEDTKDKKKLTVGDKDLTKPFKEDRNMV